MRRLYLLMLLGFTSAIVLGSLWLLVPAPEGAIKDVFYSPLGTPLTLFDVAIAIFGAYLFLRALRTFRVQLKPAYRYIAFARLSLGLLTLVYPFIEYFNLWLNLLAGMASYMPYFVSSILAYVGMRQFAKILDLRTWTRSWRILAVIILVGWAVHAFLPHAVIFYAPEYVYDSFELVLMIAVALYGSCAYMAFRLRQKVGMAYKRAFTWLSIGLGLQFTATIAVVIFDLIGYDNWYFTSRVYYVAPIIISDLSLLMAAFYFNAIAFPHKGTTKDGGPATSVDIILYAAALVSDTSKIDPYLDKMRYITSSTSSSQPVQSKDQSVLREVYLKIEDYLVNADPLRKFDRKALRETIATQLALDEKKTDTFWPALS